MKKKGKKNFQKWRRGDQTENKALKIQGFFFFSGLDFFLPATSSSGSCGGAGCHPSTHEEESCWTRLQPIAGLLSTDFSPDITTI